LYINPGFTRRIIGLKDEESDALLQLLFKVRFRIRFKIAKTLTVVPIIAYLHFG
jgi:alpha-ketoglutarate-dependent taurine dioxygenase